MEKFGVPATAPAAAVTDSDAERIKRRGAIQILAALSLCTHSPYDVLRFLSLACLLIFFVAEAKFGAAGGNSGGAKGGVEDEARKKVLLSDCSFDAG
jgi:hypothetical protein